MTMKPKNADDDDDVDDDATTTDDWHCAYYYYGSRWFRRRDRDVLRGYDRHHYFDRYHSVVDGDDYY